MMYPVAVNESKVRFLIFFDFQVIFGGTSDTNLIDSHASAQFMFQHCKICPFESSRNIVLFVPTRGRT